MSVKDMLEGEVGSVNLQKDLIQKDLITITEQHDALKAAYHALSYENAHHLQAPQVVEKSPDDTLKVSLNELQLKFEQSEESNRELKSKLTTAEKKLIELEKWPGVVNTIEERMNILLNERANLESIANNAKEEVKQYKKLTETLKDKMKKMSNNNSDTKQFLDSFEEGMRRNKFIFVICLKDEYDIIIIF
jgi:site-specific recombinase